MSEKHTATSDEADTARDTAPPLPTARVKPERRVSWLWLLPLAAIVLAAWLARAAWEHRGTIIEIHFPTGHGLKVGDPVRFRGISVGEIREVKLADRLNGIIVRASLRRQAEQLACAGTRFWIVRPRFDVGGVQGLETIMGPRYVAALPSGGARPQRRFVGLADPPVVAEIEHGDLEIILQATSRGSLRPGAAIAYRQVPIGTVLSVGLASDGSIVEARAHIPKAYRQLIREQTRFWDSGGIEADVRLTGFSVQMSSLEQLLAGGVALATPPADSAGAAVHTGHRFVLADEPEDEWLAWQPSVAVGSSLLPPGSALPHPLRTAIGWEAGFIFKGSRSRHGWVLQRPGGLLGPADLLTAEEKADRETVTLEVAGQLVALTEAPAPLGAGLAELPVQVGSTPWPDARCRRPETVEDCIAVGDPAAAPLPLAVPRLTPDDGRWLVDPAVSVDASWHGACVLSRADGRLIGLLLVEDEQVAIALLPEG